MELKQLKTIDIQDFVTSKFQDNAKEFCSQLGGVQFLTGAYLDVKGTTFPVTTAGITINHKLQRIPVGFIIMDKNANADIWRTAWDKNSITLVSSATVSIKVWVF